MWDIQHEHVIRMETAKPLPPLVMAVVAENPAEGYCMAQVLPAHEW